MLACVPLHSLAAEVKNEKDSNGLTPPEMLPAVYTPHMILNDI